MKVGEGASDCSLARFEKPESFARSSKAISRISRLNLHSRNPISIMATACVKKLKTAFAEETGRIATMVQREIMTGTLWPLNRIPETKFDASLGHNPRSIRMQIAPPTRTEYTPILAAGNKAANFVNPVTGETISGFTDKTGRGCNIPAETIHWGYDEFGRCLRATALETDPICLLDMIEKKAVATTIAALREKLPQFAKEHFANELLRQVIRFSHHKYSIAEGIPTSTNVATFPAIPTGGLNVGIIRHIENLMRHYGWDEGANTPKVNGRPALQVYAGRDSIEFAITERKKQKNIQFQQGVTTVMDSTFGQTEVYEGIQFIENPMPPRGYVIQKAANSYEFVEINPWIVRAGAEGIVIDPNPSYHASWVTVAGQTFKVLELGFIIHPRAMERQAMGSVPTVEGKTVAGRFNFEVNLVPDWAIAADPRCNKDKFYIQLRMLHAYAPFPFNPELMTAFLYIAATPQVLIVDPNGEETAPEPASEPISMRPFTAPQPETCNVCEDEDIVRDAVPPTCTDLFPENGVGVMRHVQLAYNVEEGAGNLTIVVERVGGQEGAATVDYTTTAGTAIAATNYTTTSGTLSWADGEFGPKSFNVPILDHAGDDDGKQFTVVLSSPTGATLGTPSTATVTILDADNA